MRESFLLCFTSPSFMSGGNAFHATGCCVSRPSDGDTLPPSAWQNDKFRRWRKTNFHQSHLASPTSSLLGRHLEGDQTRYYCQMLKRQKTRSYFFKFRPGWDGWQDREAGDTGKDATSCVNADGTLAPPQLICIKHELFTFGHATY